MIHWSKNKQHRHTESIPVTLEKNVPINLRECHCVIRQSTRGPEIAVGDVVILKNHSIKQLFWWLAVVQELLTESDGKVRAAVIKITDDQNKSWSLRRGIHHLISIEVRDCDEVSATPISTSSNNDPVSKEVTTMTRSRRQAATVIELNRRLNQTRHFYHFL